MKLQLTFNLKEDAITNDYRYSIVSYLKSLLSAKYPQEFDELYLNNRMKGLTFCAYFPNSTINKDFIVVPSKLMNVTISSVEKDIIIMLYNGAISRKFKPYNIKLNQEITLQKVHISESKFIDKEKILIKFLSPLLVREHTHDNHDKYLTYLDEDFNKYINMNLLRLAEVLNVDNSVGEVKLTVFNPKKTVIKHDSMFYNASIGTFILEGNTVAINLLYMAGIGSKRSLGFGMFEVVGG